MFFTEHADGKVSFRRFNSWLEKQTVSKEFILECALFLRRDECLRFGVWRTFSERFIDHYKLEILCNFGLHPKTLDVHRVMVVKYDLFLAVMAALYRIGMFAGQEKELAEALGAAFDIPLKKTGIAQALSGKQLEYESILDFFNTYRKYDF